MSLTFRGVHSSTHCLVNSVGRGLLPALKAKLVRVSGKQGAYDFGSDKDVRIFNVRATITANTVYELEDKLEAIQSWLDGDEVGELVFDSKPQVSYYAKLEGDTNIEQLGTSAFLTFTLLCPDPTGVGIEHIFSDLSTDGTIEIQNDGNEKTQPITTIDFTADETSVIITDGTKHILLGNPHNMDLPILPDYEPVMWGNNQNPALLTEATTVDGGTILGDFDTNGFSMRQKGGDYGAWDASNPYAWHGASKVQSLQVEPLENFRVGANIGFSNVGGSVGALGRIEIYLLDENGLQFGKVAFADYYGHIDAPAAEGRIGNAQTGLFMLKDLPSPADYWQGMGDGYIEIARRGREWYCYFGMRNQWGQVWRAYDKRMYVEDRFYTPKLAAIQYHIAAYKDNPAYNNMWFGTTRVDRVNRGWGLADTTIGNDTPFKKGDKLIVDNEKAAVYLNGKPSTNLVDPSSDFFSIPSGVSVLGITPNTNLTASVTVKDKYK
jgi:predicted phage tail component-like protein